MPEVSDLMRKVILTPELVGRSFVQRDCLELLQAWRDGELILVVNRPLLLRYLKLLKRLNVPQEQIRRWLWWFTSPERTMHVETADGDESRSGFELCKMLQEKSDAKAIVCSDQFFKELMETFPAVLKASEFARSLHQT